MTALGAVLFLVGLFVRPAERWHDPLMAGGVRSSSSSAWRLSSTIAGPVARALGWPVAKLFRTPGRLARDNVARTPRRTASSAAALMIGVALVSAAAVFATSLRASFIGDPRERVTADYIITDESFPVVPRDRGRRSPRYRNCPP